MIIGRELAFGWQDHVLQGARFYIAPDFSQNVSHLETTIDSVSTGMSANLLSLNQSKTEFLLIGLP